MAEVRMASRTTVADRSSGGFFIRRLVSPGAVVENGGVKPLARRDPLPSSNKENVPPAWAAWTAPKRRSALPEWYPRTPLRDITSVIKAVEWKNRLRDAAARQLQWDEDSTSQSGDAAQTDQGFQQSAPPTDETLAVVASGPAAQTAQSAACLAEGTLGVSDGCSLQTPSRPCDPPAPACVVEQQLANSIEQIEKMVRRNLKRVEPKAARPSKTPAVQRRTLMSMR
ncbi:uncharacterized protein LOC124687861 [Lolium rigidum]|uniref:uncharacterized protein LOC124687861 n=1 Tax=Lolium rigidum TaxID=89674 RepID=UPI001F5D70B7|nr:uncharacterized protein LOC124687861 [Lolium rigidum]